MFVGGLASSPYPWKKDTAIPMPNFAGCNPPKNKKLAKVQSAKMSQFWENDALSCL
jgi:hypothetical protein